MASSLYVHVNKYMYIKLKGTIFLHLRSDQNKDIQLNYNGHTQVDSFVCTYRTYLASRGNNTRRNKQDMGISAAPLSLLFP